MLTKKEFEQIKKVCERCWEVGDDVGVWKNAQRISRRYYAMTKKGYYLPIVDVLQRHNICIYYSHYGEWTLTKTDCYEEYDKGIGKIIRALRKMDYEFYVDLYYKAKYPCCEDWDKYEYLKPLSY